MDRRTGRLSYLPLPGEQPDRTPVVAPRTCRWLQVRGEVFGHEGRAKNPYGGRPVEGIVFEGLIFRHADHFFPAGDVVHPDRLRLSDRPSAGSFQGATHLPAAIHFERAHGCGLQACEIRNVGFYAVEIGAGSHD